MPSWVLLVICAPGDAGLAQPSRLGVEPDTARTRAGPSRLVTALRRQPTIAAIPAAAGIWNVDACAQ